MTTTWFIGLLIPLLGTMLGSAFVFFMKDEMSARLQKTLLGFASGVMVAASVWSLLIPAMEMSSMHNAQCTIHNEASAWSVMPAAGNSKWKSFLIGSLSGAVEPIGAIAVLLLASFLMPALPYMLAFAAGAMFYVVVEELIPEASEGQHSNLSTIGFAIGFVLMMVLDVVMG
jgi:zinc transporter ZupT